MKLGCTNIKYKDFSWVGCVVCLAYFNNISNLSFYYYFYVLNFLMIYRYVPIQFYIWTRAKFVFSVCSFLFEFIIIPKNIIK